MSYHQGQDRYQLFMTSLDQLVPSDSFAREVDRYVDDMQLKEFGFHLGLDKSGRKLYPSKELLKLLIYSYKKSVRSAQKIANLAKFNVEVMWLMKGMRPSSRTINYFRAKNARAIAKARRYFRQKLKHKESLIGAVD